MSEKIPLISPSSRGFKKTKACNIKSVEQHQTTAKTNIKYVKLISSPSPPNALIKTQEINCSSRQLKPRRLFL